MLDTLTPYQPKALGFYIPICVGLFSVFAMTKIVRRCLRAASNFTASSKEDAFIG
jgi:hypothetical protein